MEKTLSLKTKDGKKIHCIHNTSTKQNDSVVIIIHGLTGHPNEHCFFNAAQQYPKKGIDVFRFALYWWNKENRKLHECDLTTHAEDLNKVIQYLKPKYKHIHLVGHSCGSPTILKANHQKATTITLWDPSYLESGIKHELKEVTFQMKKYWLCEDQYSYFLGKDFVNEWEWFDGKNELELIKKVTSPLHIVTAQKGILTGSKIYLNAHNGPNKYTEIDGASHCFDELGTESILLKETLLWIKKYSK
jgi:hypothetical protein